METENLLVVLILTVQEFITFQAGSRLLLFLSCYLEASK